ncbi:MAG: ATP-binding protein [Candidatus Protistobacter heckmanni]|nr:ATP-binding protein [Candidatus Protistobacter heckmanni]
MHDNAVAINLYRIAQEAVTNAVKHSKASSVSLSLSRAADAIALEVCDDGVGLRASPGRGEDAGAREGGGGNGLGMSIMHYRARLIGAQFEVSASPQGGLRIALRLPAPATETAHG